MLYPMVLVLLVVGPPFFLVVVFLYLYRRELACLLGRGSQRLKILPRQISRAYKRGQEQDEEVEERS